MITNLKASSHCHGRRIELEWTNPVGTQYVRIVRRPRWHIFDLTDPHDIVYSGHTVINQFSDTGVVTNSGNLVNQTNYATLLSNVAAGAASITVDDAVNITAGNILRIEQLEGPKKYEIVRVASSPGAGVINLVTPLVNSYVTSLSHRVIKSKRLRENTFYYYTILTYTSTSPTTEQLLSLVDDSNRVTGLSIREMDSKEYIWNLTPEQFRLLDASTETDGGNSFLDKINDLMGCGLSILRGWNEAIQLLSDDDETPFHTLSAKSYSIGIAPDGFTYDYGATRRIVLDAFSVLKRKGTCPGMVRAVRMLTGWESECIEFNQSACREGATSLQTWDGTSTINENSGELDDDIHYAYGELVDDSQAWVVDIWKDGFAISSMGEIACIESNDATTLTFKTPSIITTLNGAAAAGATSVPLSSTVGLYAHMKIQIKDTASANSEIVEIASVVPGVSITVKRPLQFTYDTGDTVSIGMNLFSSEYVDTAGTWTTVTGSTRRLTDSTAHWMENQWVGYYVLTDDNQKLAILTNTATTLDVSNGSLPADGDYAIAKEFTVGATFNDRIPHVRYRVYNGLHSFIFEPTFDYQLSGTIYDPFHRLLAGIGTSNLIGVWSPNDVGLYITSNVVQHIGTASTFTTTTFELDTNFLAPGVNALTGFYLNPNQNQTRLYKILSNTSTQVTVEGDLTSFAVAGQTYFILSSRDATRYQRLVERLGPPSREFANSEINVRILFR